VNGLCGGGEPEAEALAGDCAGHAPEDNGKEKGSCGTLNDEIPAPDALDA
jgi:hypothetical protein